MKITETVLMYGPSGSNKIMRMKPSIIRAGARIKVITSDMFSLTVGELLGLQPEEIDFFASKAQISDEAAGHHVKLTESEFAQIAELKEEVLVMWNFSNEKMDRMLLNFKKSGIQRVNLKAIVTPNNIKWTFAELIHELKKEHKAYQALS